MPISQGKKLCLHRANYSICCVLNTVKESKHSAEKYTKLFQITAMHPGSWFHCPSPLQKQKVFCPMPFSDPSNSRGREECFENNYVWKPGNGSAKPKQFCVHFRKSEELSPNGAVFLEVSTNLTKLHKSAQNFHSFGPKPKDKFSPSNSGTELYSPGN